MFTELANKISDLSSTALDRFHHTTPHFTFISTRLTRMRAISYRKRMHIIKDRIWPPEI